MLELRIRIKIKSCDCHLSWAWLGIRLVYFIFKKDVHMELWKWTAKAWWQKVTNRTTATLSWRWSGLIDLIWFWWDEDVIFESMYSIREKNTISKERIWISAETEKQTSCENYTTTITNRHGTPLYHIDIWASKRVVHISLLSLPW